MEKVYYYNRNGMLQLTFGEAPYYMRLGTGKFKDQSWAYDNQFGLMKSFRRDQSSYPFSVVITSNDPADYDKLCDIFNDDIIANSPGYFLINGWKLSCYVVKAEHEFYGWKDHVIAFEAVSENSTWIRTNTRVFSGESSGLVENDYGRDYTEGLIEAGSDTAPYLFRQSPQFSNGYNNETDTLVGGSVAWNQRSNKTQFPASTTINGVTFTNNGDGTVSVVGEATAQARFTLQSITGGLKGHKMLLIGCPLGGAPSTYSLLDNMQSSNQYDVGNGKIYEVNHLTGQAQLHINVQSGTNIQTAIKYVPQLFDLTQMFGSTIADAIYAMEQSTAGSGVAFFKKLFPNSYYPYNSGELMSVSGVSSHDMTGFNAWDEEWDNGTINGQGQNTNGTAVRSKGYVSVLPNTAYYITPVMDAVFWYDEDKNLISLNYSGGLKTAPNNARYMRFYTQASYGTTYKNDICINISDTAKNGTYEPYELHSYPLDDSLTLRGIPKLSNGKLYYDGDTYASDGTVTRKYGIVDLGSLDWTYVNTSGQERFYSVGISGTIKPPANNDGVANIVSPKYITVSQNTLSGGSVDKVVACAYNGFVAIRDTAYTDATAFKTAMSGVYLVYELATPTTETAEPYTNPQVVDEYGTEEYVSTSIVPVGHQTAYGLQAALRGYNYGYSLTSTHIAVVDLPGSENGYEVTFYGPIENPIIYINNHPIRVLIEVDSGERLRITSNGSEKTIKLLSQSGQETDAFIYRDKENSPFVSLGSYSEITFGEIRFDFTTIERRSEPTWT